MLAPDEFTVGSIETATPLTLMLPRQERERTILIGEFQGAPVAVFLSGDYKFHFFETKGAARWKGLIIPNVRIEVDETSLSDASYTSAPLGSLVRTGTTLGLRVRREGGFDDGAIADLHSNLPSAGSEEASFSKWQIVVGTGADKRALWKYNR
jgi:hypothetical protein